MPATEEVKDVVWIKEVFNFTRQTKKAMPNVRASVLISTYSIQPEAIPLTIKYSRKLPASMRRRNRELNTIRSRRRYQRNYKHVLARIRISRYYFHQCQHDTQYWQSPKRGASNTYPICISTLRISPTFKEV